MCVIGSKCVGFPDSTPERGERERDLEREEERERESPARLPLLLNY